MRAGGVESPNAISVSDTRTFFAAEAPAALTRIASSPIFDGRNSTRASPVTSVRACCGETEFPSADSTRTVSFCTGLPAESRTVTTYVAERFMVTETGPLTLADVPTTSTGCCALRPSASARTRSTRFAGLTSRTVALT